MGLFNFNKNKKFISKLSIDQRDEIIITLILMKQMIDADGVEKPEEKEYYKNYLLNCGISSKEELESILDESGSLTSDEYDDIVNEFDEFQKLTILQELYGIICSDDEIDENELGLLFQISRDMKIEDDIVMDMLGANKELLEKSFEKNEPKNDTSSVKSVSKAQKTDKFCSKCGEHYSEDEKFCTSCGNKRNIVEIESKDEENLQNKIKNLNLEDELEKIKSYLESITIKEKGDIYDLNYWFDQVVTRVESHEVYYSSVDLNDSKSLNELAHSHYDEYHHRMIEENDENKLKFVVPRVECFLEIFNKIDEIKTEDLIEEDKSLYDRYFFHSKSSLYGAVKFLKTDIDKGLDELKKIYPDFDEEILNYQGNEMSNEMISKSKELLNSAVRLYFNKVLNQNAERFIEQKNSSAYNGLVEMINSSLPIDSEKMINEKKVIKEIKNLSIDEKEYLNRIITGTIVYAKLQDWELFITNAVNELKRIGVSIDEEFELEETESPLIDEWEKLEMGNEGDYILIKKNDQGVITHKKVFNEGKLDRFDLSKEKEELKKEEKRLLALLYYSFGEINTEKVAPFIKNLSEKELKSLIELMFWKIYNSYDDSNNLPALILNDYAYYLYDLNQISEGIHFASLAFKIEEKGGYADTVGEGYFKEGYFDMAFSSFSKAIEIDQKNDSHNEEHISNYINAALKTENLKSVQNGIELLKTHFKENKKIKKFENELEKLKSDLDEFKCPECGHIPKMTQKFCTKCGTKFKDDDLQEDNVYENVITYLNTTNETLFSFVKEQVNVGKRGESYPEEVLIKRILSFIDKLKTDKDLFRDIFDDNGNKKNNDENLNNLMFLTLYPKFFISNEIETLAKLLNETESDKFDGYDEIEQYYSYYVYIRDFMINESKKYMK